MKTGFIIKNIDVNDKNEKNTKAKKQNQQKPNQQQQITSKKTVEIKEKIR